MRTGKRRQIGAIVLIISISSLTFLNAWVRLQPLDQPRPEAVRKEPEEDFITNSVISLFIDTLMR